LPNWAPRPPHLSGTVAHQMVDYSHYGIAPINPEVLGTCMTLRNKVEALSDLPGVACACRYRLYPPVLG